MDITRRGFLKGAIGLAGAGMTGALTVPALKSLLPPPVTRCNEDDAHETLTYKGESGKWYESMDGDIAKKGDFKLWDVAIVDWGPKVLEEEKGGSQPAWITNATSFRFTESRLPKIAIIIDDAGLNKTMTKYAINLPGPLTISFMSYASRLEQQVNLAKKAGHEVLSLIHI